VTVVVESSAGPYLKPLPTVTEANRPFFDALAEHRFLVPKCADCGDYNWVPYPACRTCLSENQVWTEVSGEATVFTYTVVHRGPGAFDADVPYVIALGKLSEQPRPCLVLGTLVGCDPAEVQVGLPIQIAYEDIPGEDITMWRWVRL
jgi:uncharacterized OB-fold protein